MIVHQVRSFRKWAAQAVSSPFVTRTLPQAAAWLLVCLVACEYYVHGEQATRVVSLGASVEDPADHL